MNLPNAGHYVSRARHDCSLFQKSQDKLDPKSELSFQIGNVEEGGDSEPVPQWLTVNGSNEQIEGG